MVDFARSARMQGVHGHARRDREQRPKLLAALRRQEKALKEQRAALLAALRDVRTVLRELDPDGI